MRSVTKADLVEAAARAGNLSKSSAGEAVNAASVVGPVGGEPLRAWLVRPWVPYEESVPSLIVAKTANVAAQVAFVAVALVLAITIDLDRRLVIGVGVLLAIEVIALLGFRLFTIAQPARKLLYAQIESVALKLQMEGGTASKGELAHLVNEINQVRKSQEWSFDEYIREPLFWSGGRELTAWRRIHEVERHLVLFLAPSERVYQRALSVEAELRSANTPGSIALADRLRRTLDQPAESEERNLDLAAHDAARAGRRVDEFDRPRVADPLGKQVRDRAPRPLPRAPVVVELLDETGT